MQGVFTFADGSVYEGEYVGNVRSGKGKMTYADGAVYEGSWEGGKRAGSGVYTYSNGDVYRGEWADDVKQGEGVYSSKATLSSSLNLGRASPSPGKPRRANLGGAAGVLSPPTRVSFIVFPILV